jgi:hypothetical protein
MSTSLLLCDGQPLPYAYRWLVEQGLTRFGPWWFIEEQVESDGLRKEFAIEAASPNPMEVKDIQPFASMAGICDDVAGFVIRNGQVTKEVLGVHLTWAGRPEKPGWPDRQLFEDVWAFLAERVIWEMSEVAARFETNHREEPKQ